MSLAMTESHTFSIPYELMIIFHPGWIALGYTANVSLRAKPVLSAIRFVGRRIQPTLARLTFDPYLGQGRSTTYIFPSLSLVHIYISFFIQKKGRAAAGLCDSFR